MILDNIFAMGSILSIPHQLCKARFPQLLKIFGGFGAVEPAFQPKPCRLHPENRLLAQKTAKNFKKRGSPTLTAGVNSNELSS
ncbi:MAG: hypothetical protein WCO56_20395 [Verrucomicrobiota bacterium]